MGCFKTKFAELVIVKRDVRQEGKTKAFSCSMTITWSPSFPKDSPRTCCTLRVGPDRGGYGGTPWSSDTPDRRTRLIDQVAGWKGSASHLPCPAAAQQMRFAD